MEMDEALEKIIPAVEQQIDSPATPYVKEAFERLVGTDEIDEHEAKAMIAFCLADEVEALEREKRDFSEERYQTLLSFLPTMPEGR